MSVDNYEAEETLEIFERRAGGDSRRRKKNASRGEIEAGISGVDRKQSGQRVQLASREDIDEGGGAGDTGVAAGGRGCFTSISYV